MPLVNLNKKLDKKAKSSSKPHSKRSLKKMALKIFIVLVILFVAIYLPVRGVYQNTRKVVASARGIQDAAKRENLDDIRKNITEMRKANDGLNTSLNFLIWIRIIPFVGGFYGDIKSFSNAAQHELNAVQTLADSLDPYKAELGFTGQPTPGSDRIAQAVKVLDKVLPQLDKVEPDLKAAADEVKNIDVNKYPETLGRYRLRSQVETAKNFIMGAHYAVSEARPALEVAPSALGASSPKNYLLIFQNDKELRPTGGFMTAYAYLKLDKGRLSSSQSDDIYRLDEKLLRVCQSKICPLTPPDPITRYLPEADGRPRTAWSLRDSNMSPDMPTSMKDFERLYSYLGEGTPWDGIILIDTHVVEELIKITGPVEVFGTKYSAETDSRCNCPNVIYELENYAQIIEKGQEDRKAVLGTLMQQILARSLGASTDKLPEFVNAGVKLASAKHMLFYMHDKKTEEAMGDLNWVGKIKDFNGDYLHINDANFAGGKSNLYVSENVLLEIDTKTGKHKLTVNYKNPQPYNIWLNGINRDYVRVYVPKGSKLITSKGSDVKVSTIEDLGRTAFEGFIQVRPANSRQYILEYQSPIKPVGRNYPMMVQKQPGTKDFNYEIKVDGKTEAKFKLDSDKQLNLSI